jgi:peroxiredoxin Q/BCP
MSKNNLSVGDMIPSFSLKNQEGELIKICSDDSIKKVIFFYPKNNTRVCTIQACTFRDWQKDFLDLGYQVIGISEDTIQSHEKFVAKHNLKYTLLSDKKGKVRKQFGVSALLGLISGRKTFVVNKSGTIEFVYDSMMEGEEHIKKTLNFIKSK